MKKLMVVIAVALASYVSQAASAMKWGTGTVYKPDTTDTSNPIAFSSTKAGSTVSLYLFELTQAQYLALTTADTLPLSYSEVSEKIFSKYATVDGTTFTVSGQTTSGKTSSSKKTFTDSATYGKGDTAYAAMILKFSDTTAGQDYYIANIGSYYFDADMDGEIASFGTHEFGGETTTLSGWTAVPEPTSGLLLLLGVAGLALRRRRA